MSEREVVARPARGSFDDSSLGGGHGAESHGAGAEEIHLPPNSWVPISVALSLCLLFIGFLQERPFNFIVCVLAGAWLIASLVGWYTSARTEYGELH